MQDDTTKTQLIAFRCDPPMAKALRKLADRRVCPLSVVAREGVAQQLRAAGLLDEPA